MCRFTCTTCQTEMNQTERETHECATSPLPASIAVEDILSGGFVTTGRLIEAVRYLAYELDRLRGES